MHFYVSLVQNPGATGSLIPCAATGALRAAIASAQIHPRIDTPAMTDPDVMVPDLADPINPRRRKRALSSR